MTTNYPLTTEEFRTWLESKDENEVVGKARHICNCPLSTFLKEKVGNEFPYVGVFSTYIPTSETNTLEYNNPQWVISFISKLDGKFQVASVTAKQSLEVLKEIHDIFN